MFLPGYLSAQAIEDSSPEISEKNEKNDTVQQEQPDTLRHIRRHERRAERKRRDREMRRQYERDIRQIAITKSQLKGYTPSGDQPQLKGLPETPHNSTAVKYTELTPENIVTKANPDLISGAPWGRIYGSVGNKLQFATLIGILNSTNGGKIPGYIDEIDDIYLFENKGIYYSVAKDGGFLYYGEEIYQEELPYIDDDFMQCIGIREDGSIWLCSGDLPEEELSANVSAGIYGNFVLTDKGINYFSTNKPLMKLYDNGSVSFNQQDVSASVALVALDIDGAVKQIDPAVAIKMISDYAGDVNSQELTTKATYVSTSGVNTGKITYLLDNEKHEKKLESLKKKLVYVRNLSKNTKT
jgi:hypothetical protein